MIEETHSFDLNAFLAEPQTVRVATNGPTIRPLWYQWEDGCFWIINGPWAKLYHRILKDPKLALLIDVDERDRGRIYQVMVSGIAEITPYDIPRARRMLHRYLGPDEASWSTAPDDYPGYLREPGPPGAVWLKIKPTTLKTFNFSYVGGPFAPDNQHQ
jgi:nitroimidazol reductase NimA-like FMN-containing flavoprotein (pyridoxamine 5'-phosphate oxidase superfamily)